MNSIILQISSKYLKFLLVTFAVLALLRGHNMPGGGFIGGLLAALSVVIASLAYSPQYIFDNLKMKPRYYIGIGLALILSSLLPSILLARNLMKGVWFKMKLPIFSEIKMGTPLVFDTGVFFVVIGVTLMLFFSLSIKKQWK